MKHFTILVLLVCLLISCSRTDEPPMDKELQNIITKMRRQEKITESTRLSVQIKTDLKQMATDLAKMNADWAEIKADLAKPETVELTIQIDERVAKLKADTKQLEANAVKMEADIAKQKQLEVELSNDPEMKKVGERQKTIQDIMGYEVFLKKSS